MRRGTRLDGEQAKALMVALEHFRAMPDIPSHKKDLANYELVAVREETREFVVHLEPKRLPQDMFIRGGETSLGVEITLFVDKTSWQVKRVQRYM